MSAASDDWRRTGQEAYLAGLPFTWKKYQAYTGDWEHDHCEFCWTKFLDPDYADWMREALASDSDGTTDAGYTNVRHEDVPAGRHWVCRRCFNDFRTEFEWTVAESDP